MQLKLLADLRHKKTEPVLLLPGLSNAGLITFATNPKENSEKSNKIYDIKLVGREDLSQKAIVSFGTVDVT